MHGNGIMEISARGSLQIRGLNAVSAPLFAEAVDALGIDLCESVPVLCDPLPDDPAALIESPGDRRGAAPSHRRCRARARAESLRGDRRRRAHRSRRGSPPISGCAPPRPAKVQDFMSRSPATPRRRRKSASSLRKTRSMPCWLCSRPSPPRESRRAPPICCRRATRPRRRTPARASRGEPIGLHPLKDGACALGVGLAFGHAEADALKALAEIATAHGARWARPAPDRSLVARASQRDPGDGAVRRGATARLRRPTPTIRAAASSPVPGAPACAQRSDRGARARGGDRARRAACGRGPRPARLGLRQRLRASGAGAAHHRRHRARLRRHRQRHGARDAVDLSRSKPSSSPCSRGEPQPEARGRQCLSPRLHPRRRRHL